MKSLFCSLCGCGYMGSRLRRAGVKCGDASGGVNTDANPCAGILRLEKYTREVRERQRVSMRMTHEEQDLNCPFEGDE